jgi:hydrogenase large subunit
MIGAQCIHDHVMHFYHLHALDWVDVVSALSADPKATSQNWPSSRDQRQLAQVLARLFPRRADAHQAFVESGQLGIFANGYWGHPAYKLPPEANLMAVAHYLEALAWQRRSPSCTPSSAARTRIRTSSSAACPAPSMSTASARWAPSTWSG